MKNKGLWLDVLVGVIIIGVIALSVFALRAPTVPEGELAVLTLNVTRNPDIIYPEAAKLEDVYFNNSNFPVRVTGVTKTTRNGAPALEIKLEAKGLIEKGETIFNGQRVLISQKAEIHGNYFAQGVIQDVKYK